MAKQIALIPLGSAPSGGDHAVVLVHGVTQDAEDIRPFGEKLRTVMPSADVYLFDYNWTRALVDSGEDLALELATLPHERIDLVGYSMGGLVARVAVADHDLATVRTIVTVATPNRGALSVAQLLGVGQDLLSVARLVAPLLRCDGVLDLTRATDLMKPRGPVVEATGRVIDKRYASVPGRFYHRFRPEKARSKGMGRFHAILSGISSVHIDRPHDGIVEEDSTKVTGREEFMEFEIAAMSDGTPAHLHATHYECDELDHINVLSSDGVAGLVGKLIETADWATLKDTAKEHFTPRD